MARKLLCSKCDKELSKLALKYNELYESVEGISQQEFRCDDCGKDIHLGDNCFAAVLLPDKNHFQYKFQKPDAWISGYISPISTSLTSVITLMLLLNTVFCVAQSKNYKEYEICTSIEIHKGKVNHGKPYCTSWATVREYKNGVKDTISWFSAGKTFIGNEYEMYNKLSERGKYIVDSLKEDGIAQLQDSYLVYEPMYMRYGRKVEQLWTIQGENVMIYKYLFWRNTKGHGIKLVNEVKTK